MPKLAGLWIYPVKSLGGIPLDEAVVEARGLRFDRRWMIVDTEGHFLTQRQFPAMARLRTAITDSLQIQGDATKLLEVPLETEGPRVNVQVWHDEVEAVDCGDGAADFLSQALNTSCRLVQMPNDSRRKVDPDYASEGEVTSFSDGFPFLTIGDGSLHALNDRLIEKGDEPVEIERFRPNFFISGVEPFAEDSWGHFRIGSVEFEAVKPCSRCVITTLDPQSGQKTGGEPLRTLGEFRRGQKGVYFGQNLLGHSEGKVQIGDEITIDQLRALSPLLSF